MPTLNPTFALALAAALCLFAAVPGASAQTAPAKKQAATKFAKKPVAKSAAPVEPAAATADQVDAAGRVYYGVYDCEFKQTINIGQSSKYPSYVDVKHNKSAWLMRPVLSSTGAIRLEDVSGETLMVQVAQKSMLLNVKTGHRVVDECISPRQRELAEEAKAAKTAATETMPATK